MYLDELMQRVAAAEPPIHVIPCSEEEITALEAQLNVRLPDAYKEFLRWMGRDGGPILRGSQCFYKYLLNIQEWAVERLEESKFPKRLPDDAFVFYMHQGYQFTFFRVTEGENPPVYFFHEMREQQDFVVSQDHYTEFVEAFVNDSLEYWKANPNWHLRFMKR